MLNKKIHITIFVIIFSCINIFAQTRIPKQEAVVFYNSAKEMYSMGNIHGAIQELNKAILADSLFMKPYQDLARLYYEYGNLEEMKNIYLKIIKINANEYPESYYYLGFIEFKLKNYENSIKYFSKLLNYRDVEEKFIIQSQNKISQAKFIIEALKNPVPFNPINMGNNINSEYDEYLPSLSLDEEMLVITVQVPKTNFYGGSKYQEDFFISQKNNENWNPRESINDINTEKNEGAQSLSADGKFLYFSACNRDDSFGECDIYFSQKTSTGWTKPKNIGPSINSKYWEAQPSISPDGKELYFASNRPGGYGNSDIWVSKFINGRWSYPENLGENINTKDVDQFPFIHSDNQTLYFGSNGHIGMGGTDLFLSRKINNNWTLAENIGYPINTENDELSLFVSPKGNVAYFASNKEGGYGKQDIYQFELHEKARPISVTYMKGKIYDNETSKKLEANFELIDLQTGKTLMNSTSDSINGEFLISIPSKRNYALNVSRNGYLFYSDNFFIENSNTALKPYIKDIPLKKLKVGESVILKNIFYKVNSYELLDESVVELNKLISFINYYPNIKIEISGHTDNTGSYDLNSKLSFNRAKSVYEYLISKGISSNKLTFKGYADTKPISSNSNAEGKALNRRTEFKITSLTQ